MNIYIDEAGRGPLAGPIYAGFVFGVGNLENYGFKDSKKISEKQREILYQQIRELEKQGKLGFTYCSISSNYVDKYGISLCMQKLLVEGISKTLKQAHKNLEQIGAIYFDGNTDFGASKQLNKNITTVVKGDEIMFQISIASIIAKVLRDKYMIKISKKYPEYDWSQNKGYGTQKHIQAIKNFGTTPFHRKSFLTNITN